MKQQTIRKMEFGHTLKFRSLVLLGALLLMSCARSEHFGSCRIGSNEYSIASLQSVTARPLVFPQTLFNVGYSASLCSLEDPKSEAKYLAIAAEAYARAANEYELVHAHEAAVSAQKSARRSAEAALQSKGLDRNTKAELSRILHDSD